MKLLISGFEPFGKDTVNASWEAVRALPDRIGSAEITKLCVPVEYRRSWLCLRESIRADRPDMVICVGQATGRSCITPEKVGINWMCASLPDNAGTSYAGEPICPDGADGYFSTFSPERMVSALHAAKIPASVSYTAGTYVCNCLLYQLLHYLSTENPAIRGGFIHVPCLPEQALAYSQMPSMALSEITQGLTEAVRSQITG